MARNLDVARRRCLTWEKMEGVSTMRKEEVDLIMEVDIGEGVRPKELGERRWRSSRGEEKEKKTSLRD